MTGWRADITPTASLNLSGPGYFVRPAVAYSATQYELDNTLPGEDKSPSRNLPIASFDTGLQFERDLDSGANRRITLEPRMMYLYAPYRNQNDIPVFDTALPDLVPVELFRTNRYVGADRISDADQIAYGVTSRLLDGHDGRQFIAVTLGQIYYFETPKVLLPYEAPLMGSRSDTVAQIAINAFQDWNSNIGLQWSPQESRVERADINIQYKPDVDKVVNLAYRFERGTIHPASQCNIIDAEGKTKRIDRGRVFPGRHLRIRAGRAVGRLADCQALEPVRPRGLLPAGQAGAGKLRRVRVRLVLLARALRGTPLHQQAPADNKDPVTALQRGPVPRTPVHGCNWNSMASPVSDLHRIPS